MPIYSKKTYYSYKLALLSLIGLIILCLLWEWKIAPIHHGGSWLILKVLPLCFALKGCIQGRIYTFQYMTMLILFYFAEGVVRLFDIIVQSQICAGLEILLSVIFFVSSIILIRTSRR